MHKVKAAFPTEFSFIRTLMEVLDSQACDKPTDLSVYLSEGRICVSSNNTQNHIEYAYNENDYTVLVYEQIYDGYLREVAGPTLNALDSNAIEVHLQKFFGFEA